MQLLYGIIAVAIALLAATCTDAMAPVSRGSGYTTSIDLRLPLTSEARSKVVLESEKFLLWLEGDDLNKCSLSVRMKYGMSHDPSHPGYLVWTANYFSRTPTGAEKCTLTFTAQGELELWIVLKGKSSLTWSSKTAGKGVTDMALETSPDNGNFKLLTAANKAILSSFDLKEWLILSDQEFWRGDSLKSPDQKYPGNDTIVLANGGKYIMVIKDGDLQLQMNGPKPQVFWSFKQTSNFKGDISKAEYAAVHGRHALGLFTSDRKLVYTLQANAWGKEGPDHHFGIDAFGNLQYYLQFRGMVANPWMAIQDLCLLPNFCGQYGMCTSKGPDFFGEYVNECIGCPPGFTVDSSQSPPACERITRINKCNHAQYMELKGFESGFLPYQTPTKESLEACQASCSADCNCDGFFYKAKKCYKQTQMLTLKKDTAKNGAVAYIKFKYVNDRSATTFHHGLITGTKETMSV